MTKPFAREKPDSGNIPELLVLSGSNDRAIYAICRVARRLKIEFFIVAAGSGDKIFQGRYKDRICYSRKNRELDLENFTEWVKVAREWSGSDNTEFIVVPSSEFLNSFLLNLERAGELGPLGVRLPLVNADLYARLSNKGSATLWAESIGMYVPERLTGFFPENLPLVAKPLMNIHRDGLLRYPQLIGDREDLDKFLMRDDCESYFAQEMIRGNSWYLMGYLSRDGRAWLHAQRNIAQQPEGKSVLLAWSDDFEDSETGRKIVLALRDTGFFGLFMIEFKGMIDRPVFIEINPRPWGPLQLSIDAGSGIVEAFLGDSLYGDPDRFIPPPAPARRACYLWLGGFFSSWRMGKMIHWHNCTSILRWFYILRALPCEVYLRLDSWRVFWRELCGSEH